jgi:hypothetical protein
VEHAVSDSEIAGQIREVTDDEVALYQAQGWVKLDHLITPEFAAELLRAGRAWHERHGKSTTAWSAMAIQPDAEPFGSFMFSSLMGRNAQRLVNRARLSGVDVPLRYRNDHFVERGRGSNGSSYHQDSAEHGSDRAGELQFWLALAEVTPEMGAMRFVTGSHREGPLGAVLKDLDGDGDLLQVYPRLTDVLDLSPPLHYQPGDCTVHHGYTVHGAPPNSTDQPRLSYIFSYTPADTRWWNGEVKNWGSERLVLSDQWPIVYPRP